MEVTLTKYPKEKLNEAKEVSISINNLCVSFGASQVLKNISINLYKNKVNCIIGPSGSGKSTLLRSLNRINDDVVNIKTTGEVSFLNSNILEKNQDITKLRKDIGMVFQSPCVFPKSISENIIFGVQQHRKLSKSEKSNIVEHNLKAVSLWPEVSSRLKDFGTSLSIGQQQRLCIARTLAIMPKVILMDEPTSSLDPISTRAIESLINELKKKYTIVLVTHNIAQAKRIADHVFFICNGELIEEGPKNLLFLNPKKEQTKSYLKDETCNC
jgi:phosphate transport system ATP-binding protein